VDFFKSMVSLNDLRALYLIQLEEGKGPSYSK